MSSAFHCLLFTWSSVYKQVHLSSKNWTFFLSTAPFDAKGWLIWKDPDVGKDWKQEEKGTTGDGCMASRTQWTWVWVRSESCQGGLSCWGSWGHGVADTTEQLNWTELNWMLPLVDSPVSLSELRELVMDREAWRAAIHGVAKSRTWLSDWTELNWIDRANILGQVVCIHLFLPLCLAFSFQLIAI